MRTGLASMLGLGLALASGGVFVFSRPAGDASAIYRRRIAGTMLCAFGTILMLFVALLWHAGQ